MLRNDHHQWWLAKFREIEKVGDIANRPQLYKLIKNVGIWKPSLSDVIMEFVG